MINTKIAVVVVTYNGAVWIADCLSSLRDHECQVQAIVVDNASTDATVAIIERDFPEVHLIKLAQNVGFGVGNNVGISQAIAWEADYILLLNQDAYVLPGTLVEMGGFMGAHPAYGVCSPLHCSPDEHTIDLRTFRTYLRRYAQEYLCDAIMGRAKEHYTIHGVNAAVWFVRADTFARVGGFDPLFFMYGEDDDMLSRMAYHEVKFALLTRVRVVHQRQSPSTNRAGPFARLQRKTRRRSSYLLKEVKLPQNSATFMVSLLISRGLVRPLADVIVDWDLESFAANLAAAGWVGSRFLHVWRNARRTSKGGAHFLATAKSRAD